MEIKKWDGVTDADDILKALLYFIRDEDLKRCIGTSYGDYGKYLCKHYKYQGAGNGGIYTIQGDTIFTHLEQSCKANTQAPA